MTQGWDVGRVRALLVRAGERGGSYNGSRLVELVRGFEPTFDARVLGDPSLTALLGRFPDLGRCEIDHGGLTFHFGPDDTEHPEADWLRREVWEAVVGEGENMHFDLGTLRIADDPALVRAEPERFVEIPRLDSVMQREVRRAFAAAQPDDAGAALDPELGRDEWLEACRVARLDRDWSERFAACVIEHVTGWAARHGILMPALLDRKRISRASPKASADALRRALHVAIDAMEESELRGFAALVKRLAGTIGKDVGTRQRPRE